MYNYIVCLHVCVYISIEYVYAYESTLSTKYKLRVRFDYPFPSGSLLHCFVSPAPDSDVLKVPVQIFCL